MLSLLYGPTLTWLLEKTIVLIRWTFVSKVMSLLFNMLSRFVIAFLPRSKCLLISWLQSPSADFGAQENKVCHCFQCFPIYSPWSDGTGCHDLCFWMLKFKPAFPLSSFTFIKRLLFLFTFCHKGGVCISEVIVFLLAILIPTCASSIPSCPL